jgi:hypothetical protein
MTDFLVIDELLQMGSGYVLNFSDFTFSQFFAEQGINIDDPRYREQGTSKAKRLRFFLKSSPPSVAANVLTALLEHRLLMPRTDKPTDQLLNDYRRILRRLGGSGADAVPTAHASEQHDRPPPVPSAAPPVRTRHSDHVQGLEWLREEFLALQAMTDRQKAGKLFEFFLNRLFSLFDLQPTKPFEVTGEQIDGAFMLDTHVYLVEAKWYKDRVEPGELYQLRTKIEGKTAFTRGVFISVSGYTPGGLEAIRTNKQPNFLMVDGSHLFRVLSGGVRLDAMLRHLVRVWAEQGRPYVPVAEMGDL